MSADDADIACIGAPVAECAAHWVGHARSTRRGRSSSRRMTGTGVGMLEFVKRLLVGRPLATTEQEHQRIPKTIALAVFSSDAISSTAYATEEILFVTAVGASSLDKGLNTLIPISIAVATLLTIVAFSYRQTIFAYPSGGG